MRHELYSRDGKLLGTLDLKADIAEVWRAMQRLQVQLRPAPVAPVVATTTPSKPKGKRSTHDAS